jgi:hypothetical protein
MKKLKGEDIMQNILYKYRIDDEVIVIKDNRKTTIREIKLKGNNIWYRLEEYSDDELFTQDMIKYENE